MYRNSFLHGQVSVADLQRTQISSASCVLFTSHLYQCAWENSNQHAIPLIVLLTPFISWMLTSACFSTRDFTVYPLPSLTAMCRGVCWLRKKKSTCNNSQWKWMTSVLPLGCLQGMRVIYFQLHKFTSLLSWMLMLASFFTRYSTIFRWPPLSAATCRGDIWWSKKNEQN